MKSIRYLLLSTTIAIASCNVENKKEKTLEQVETKSEKKEEITPIVSVNIEALTGYWKYSEVRTAPLETGTAPMGEILLGINDKKQFSFATSGMEELKSNLKSIPTNFKIIDNTLFPLEKLDETDFKISFNNKSTQVFLLNENELVLGKGISEANKPIIYMYFKKIKE